MLPCGMASTTSARFNSSTTCIYLYLYHQKSLWPVGEALGTPMPILRQYGTDNHGQSPCLLSCPGMRKQDRARWAETLAPWTHLLQLPQVLCANGTRHSAATLKTSSTQFVFTSYPFLRKRNAGVQKVSSTSDKSSNATNFEGSSFASRRGLSRALCLCRNQCKRAWNSMCGCWAIGAHHESCGGGVLARSATDSHAPNSNGCIGACQDYLVWNESVHNHVHAFSFSSQNSSLCTNLQVLCTSSI